MENTNVKPMKKTMPKEVYDMLKEENENKKELSKYNELQEAFMDKIPEEYRACTIPEDYVILAGGVFKMEHSKKGGDYLDIENPVSRTPILLSNIISNEDGLEVYELAVLVHRKWQKIRVQASVLGSASDTAKFLKSRGVSITPTTARRVLDYLDAMEKVNEALMTPIEGITTNGWHGDTFFYPQVEVDGYEYSDYLVDRFSDVKNADKYAEVWKKYYDTNIYTKIAFTAALSAPFLHLCGVPNFIVYFMGNSESGKTCLCNFGVSAWFNTENNKLSFDATTTGLELSMQAFNDLPVFLDERQNARGSADKQNADIKKLIFGIEQGNGRVRGTKELVARKQKKTRCVVLATGEQSLIDDESVVAGALNRYLNIDAIGVEKLVSDEVINELYATASVCYGGFGVDFVDAVMKKYTKEGIYEKFSDLYVNAASKFGKEKTGRNTKYIAFLAFVGGLIDEVIFNRRANSENFMNEMLEFARGKQSVNDAERAKQAILQYISMKSDSIPDIGWLINQIQNKETMFSEENPHSINISDYRGFYEENKEGTKNKIYLVPCKLKEYMDKAGFSFSKVMKELAVNGFVESGNNGDYNIRIHKRALGNYGVGRYIVLDVDIEDEEPSTPPVTPAPSAPSTPRTDEQEIPFDVEDKEEKQPSLQFNGGMSDDDIPF